MKVATNSEYMKDYPLSAKSFFPSLKALEICNLINLQGWGRRDVAAEQAPSYTYLEHLRLQTTTVNLCLHLIYVSSSLKHLFISGIKNVISLPERLQHLSNLQTSILVVAQLYHTRLATSHRLQSLPFASSPN